MQAMIAYNQRYSLGALFGTCFLKFLATGICLGFGFVGGNMFAYLVSFFVFFLKFFFTVDIISFFGLMVLNVGGV